MRPEATEVADSAEGRVVRLPRYRCAGRRRGLNGAVAARQMATLANFPIMDFLWEIPLNSQLLYFS